MKRFLRWPVLVTALFALANLAAWLMVRHALLDQRIDTVRVVAVLPSGDADSAERIAYVFDRRIGGEEDAAAPDPASLFTIDPAPPGRWRWAAPDRLEFVLSEPLPPGRTWRVRPTDRFATVAGRRLTGDRELGFRTRALALVSESVAVGDRDRLDLNLRFNQPVVPVEVASHLTVTDPVGDRPLPFATLSGEPGARVTFRMARPSGSFLRFRLAADLAGRDAERPLGRACGRILSVPRTFGVLGTDFGGFLSGDHSRLASVSVRFSAPVDRTIPPPRIRVDPPVENLTIRHGRLSEVCLRGSFVSGARYTLTVPAGTVAADRRVLEKEQSATVEIPPRRPSVDIPYSRGILSPKGNLVLPVQVVNTPRLVVDAYRVHENNLVPYLMGLRKSAAAREIATKELRVRAAPNEPKELALDLEGLLGSPRGLYLISVRTPDGWWPRDRAVVAVTDLAITVKRGRTGLLAWVTSLSTGRPVAAAVVTALSRTNQPLASAETGADGVARLPVRSNDPDGPPRVVTARRGEDLSYLELSRHPWMIDDVDLGGREAPETYDAFLYPEREVYRPGDTIHLTGILRTAEGGLPERFPIAVTPVRPDGFELPPIVVTPGAQGVFQLDVPTTDDSRTGPWRFVAALPGATTPVGSTRALVEAFVPARIEIFANPGRDRYAAGDKPAIDVRARYLFDQAAAGLPVRVTGRYRPEAFRSAAHPGYRFDPVLSRPDVGGTPRTAEGKLNAGGRARLELPPPPGPEAARLRLTASVTVTEPGSRSVSQTVSTVVDPLTRHVGLKLPAAGFVLAGTPVRVAWIARTPDDRPASPGRLDLVLYSVRHDWVMKEVDGRYVFESVEHPAVVEKRTVPAAGAAGELEFTFSASGRYRLEVTDPGTGATTRLELWAAESDARARAARTESPERVELIPDRAEYEPGSVARVLLRSPFPGTLLVTLETDRVVAHEVVSLPEGESTIRVPIPPTLRGGAFVTASVVRKVDPTKSEWLPHRASGIVRLRLGHAQHRLPVTIEAADRTRPGARVAVTVRVPPAPEGEAPAVVHLFAVDEGILQSTAMKTPDPAAWFFAPRRLGVETEDLFADLIPDRPAPEDASRIGGDADRSDGAAGRLRRSPVPARRRRAAVVCERAVEVDGEGKAAFEMTVPDLQGALRLMAVAVAGDRYGSAERRLVVTTDLVVLAGWPRFLAPGDRVEVPLKVQNQTDRARTVSLGVALSGPAALEAPPEPLTVPAHAAATAFIAVTATGTGVADATVTAAAKDGGPPLSVTVRDSFPVRPAGPIDTRYRSVPVPAGGSVVIPPEPGFAPGAIRRLELSGRPEVELRPALDALIDYPYGCVEQTTSRMMAILAAPELLRTGADSEGDRADLAREAIRSGIRRLLSMQTAGGGLAYWPGSAEPTEFGTAYAAAFLLDARRAGYEVPEPLLAGALRYLRSRLDVPSDHPKDPNLRALVCRVLAGSGRPPSGWMARLAEHAGDLDLAGRAHLAAAFFAAGRRDRALEIVEGAVPGVEVPVTTTGRLTSTVRQQGVLLSTLLDIAPDHPWIPDLVRHLTESRAGGRWRSTLEDAAAVAALSRYLLRREAAGPAPEDFRALVSVGNRELSGGSTAPISATLAPGDEPIRVRVEGAGTARVVVRTEGVLSGPDAAEYDRGLSVRRRWFDEEGRPVDLSRLQVGDLVRVDLVVRRLRAAGDRTIGNVAIVDALPGGFEVENPRLATSAAAAIPGTAREAGRVEFLDDRVVIFADVGSRPLSFSYALRVVASGRFALPPVQASCMYDPALASIHGAARVEVAR